MSSMAEKMEEEDDQEFIPRPYQMKLYEQACKRNTIIYLPTGSGKTYIAALLVKKFSADLRKPYQEDGKRTIFIVNTTPLVNQQSLFMARHTGLKCKGFTGDMNVDYWTPDMWSKEIVENQIMVMTAQIFYNVLIHGFMTLQKVNLIMFDECHRAVDNHPMRLIMKQFEHVPVEKQPRVLGLSATLLNSNVILSKLDVELRNLEVTFLAKIETVDDYSHVKNFSTNPKELVQTFDPPSESDGERMVKREFQKIKNFLSMVHIHSKQELDKSSDIFKSKTKTEKLGLMLKDIEEDLLETGIYGGDKAVLHQMVQLEYMKKISCDDPNYIVVLNYMISKMALVRKMLHNEMSNIPEEEQIFEFSSYKIKALFRALKEFRTRTMEKNNEERKPSCIIFVERRCTAKVLYQILKSLSSENEEYNFLIPGFMTGSNVNMFKSARENLCLSKWNKETLLKFRNGAINCLVATNVVDEGIDVPICNVIIRYTLPSNFRSYIQSKGRARHSTSEYIMLVDNTDQSFVTKYQYFQKMEEKLKQILLGKTDIRHLPDADYVKNILYTYNVEPYRVTTECGDTSFINEHNAISLINRYCTSLYSSKFISLAPTWTLFNTAENVDQKYQVSVQLPIVSPLREEIFGPPMPSIDVAKSTAAYAVCVKLYQIGELTDHFLPKDNSTVADSAELDYLYPNWETEMKSDDQDVGKPGTSSMKRQHKIVYPEELNAAYPRPDEDLYLHIFDVDPKYCIPTDNRRLVFHTILKKKSTFAILSTKKIPEVPEFPIFMNVGELSVRVRANHECLRLSASQIENLKVFHTLIFLEIVRVIKDFMVFDLENKENSFLVVPVDDDWKINWPVVEKHQQIIRTEPSVRNVNDSYDDYELTLITPEVYRGCSTVYIVTQVCDDLTAESAFPTDHFRSYSDYFKSRHGLVIKNVKQPMLEVKPVSMKINCIRPRSVKPGASKRKRANELEDFEEHLVPELCRKVEFPSLYWLKGTTLPSIMHRLSQLLIAEKLRSTIAVEMNIGVAKLSPGEKWMPLTVPASNCDQSMTDSLQDNIEDIVDNLQIQQVQEMAPEIDVLDTDNKLYCWDQREPTDLERNVENIRLLDIEYYFNFMKGTTEKDEEALVRRHSCRGFLEVPNDIPVPTLGMLELDNLRGPEPSLILQALTSSHGNDGFNSERLETLGDAFLKFACSLYLHEKFPTYGEGRLTAIKGKIVGNRNLYYCGKSKSIPGMIKVDEFVPSSNSITPAYSVDRNLQEIMIDVEVCPNFLYEFSLSNEEKLSGYMEFETLESIQTKMMNWTDKKMNTGMEHYLGYQLVADKVVSDSVEALLGVYVKECGIKGAAQILKWFQILPSEFSIDEVFFGVPPNPNITGFDPDVILHMPDEIEQRIGYKFKNRAYLLQAMTHPSYIFNQMTSCYQRLEFLGDAILDTLITCHIFETCENLDPGGLTDLRSALVNNITFACLAVRHGLHTTLLAFAPQLQETINRFVIFQEERKHTVDDELLWILVEEDECKMAEHVDVPKVLGDLFESLIGAIYLDSGKNLQITWNIVYKIMHQEIEKFKKNVPKHPVRVLYEMEDTRPRFSNAIPVKATKTVMIPLEVRIRGKTKLFHGFGGNKKQAKCAAAKQALKCIKYVQNNNK